MRIFLSLFGSPALRSRVSTAVSGATDDAPDAAQVAGRRDALAARRRPPCPATAPSFAPVAAISPPSRVRDWVFGSDTPCDSAPLNDTNIVSTSRTAAVHAAIIKRLWKQDANFIARLPDHNLLHLCAAFPHVCAVLQGLDRHLQARLQALQARTGLAAAACESDDEFSETEDSLGSDCQASDANDEAGMRIHAIATLDATSSERQCSAVLYLHQKPGRDGASVQDTCMLLREHLVHCPYPKAQMYSMRALTHLMGVDAAADIEPFLFSRHPDVAERARTLMLSLGHQRACALARLWHGHARYRIDGMWLALLDSGEAGPRRQLTALLVLQALVEPAPEVRKELLDALIRLGSQQVFDVASWYALDPDASLARHARAVLRRLAVDGGLQCHRNMLTPMSGH